MLTIFNAENKIVPGENLTQFTQLEYIATASASKGLVIPNLGLFGSASVGKTTSVKLLANKLNHKLLSYNAVTLDAKTLYTTLYDDIGFTYNCKVSKKRNHPDGNWIARELPQPTIIFIDEAHLLSREVQTLLLTALEPDGLLHNEGYVFLPEDVTWIFATTDSSKLAYPLLTRIFPITFSSYSKQDIVEMIRLHYPKIVKKSAEVLAACSKLIPRMALKYSQMFYSMYSTYTVKDTMSFANGVLGMDERGIDNIDKRIILYLSSAKKQVSKIDEISYRNFSKELESLNKITKLSDDKQKRKNTLLFKVAVLEASLNANEYLPKSRQDISLGCNIKDMMDLETRLAYLESLKFVVKTPKGIVLTPHVK